MFQTFYELPQRAVERVGTPSFSPLSAMAPFMKSTSVWRLARMSWSMLALCLQERLHLLDEGAGIAVELDAKSFRDGLSFGDEGVEKVSGGSEAGGCTVMEKGESADRIGGSVENEFGPLRAAGVFEGMTFRPARFSSSASFSTRE